ncbi:MAG: IS1595 family transposase [Pseudomonadota bacterium]|jgi:transposase-like protein|nr:IS1595 family transposase [Pseudomonadota bacterium]
MTNLTDPIFTNEEAARAHFEAIRWPDGRVCPHCGTIGNSTLMQGKTTRAGLYKCKDCRKPFTATMGAVYERSHIPLHKWLLATHLLVSSKKGMSAHQLFRMLGLGSYRTAWFMAMRIREAMRPESMDPMGGGGGTVEVDETFTGRQKGGKKVARSVHHKMKVLSLLDRTTGRTSSVVIPNMKPENVLPILRANIAAEARVMTDDAGQYRFLSRDFAEHHVVRHESGEYALPGGITANTIEGYFSIFKRGMRGVYQRCAQHHLHRYLAEFDFRYTNREAVGTNDAMRALKAVRGTVGKRVTYQQPDQQAA